MLGCQRNDFQERLQTEKLPHQRLHVSGNKPVSPLVRRKFTEEEEEWMTSLPVFPGVLKDRNDAQPRSPCFFFRSYSVSFQPRCDVLRTEVEGCGPADNLEERVFQLQGLQQIEDEDQTFLPETVKLTLLLQFPPEPQVQFPEQHHLFMISSWWF